MNTLRSSTVALTLVLFTMGALILPVNTALAHCTENGKHSLPGCDAPHGGGDPEPTATFSVVVDLDGNTVDDGSVTVTEVKINGNRQSLNGTMLSPDLTLLTGSSGLPCTIMWGNPDPAQFSISTAKIPPSSTELTYVEASIYDFTLSSTGAARFSLSFVPYNVTLNSALFPPTSGTPNVLTGDEIGVSISPDHGSCSGTIVNHDWTITVSKDP